MNSGAAGVLRLEALLGYQKQQQPLSKLPTRTCLWASYEQGQVQEGPTYVVNPLELLLKQTLPDRDSGSEEGSEK